MIARANFSSHSSETHMRNYTKILRIYGIIIRKSVYDTPPAGNVPREQIVRQNERREGACSFRAARVTTFGGSKPPPCGQTRCDKPRQKLCFCGCGLISSEQSSIGFIFAKNAKIFAGGLFINPPGQQWEAVMEHKHSWPKWLSAFLFAVAVITVYKTFDNLSNVFGTIRYVIGLLTPFTIGIGLAFFLYPGYPKLESLLARSRYPKIAGAKKGLSILVVYTGFLLILFIGISTLMPRLSASVADLVMLFAGLYGGNQPFSALSCRAGRPVGNDRCGAAHSNDFFRKYIRTAFPR